MSFILASGAHFFCRQHRRATLSRDTDEKKTFFHPNKGVGYFCDQLPLSLPFFLSYSSLCNICLSLSPFPVVGRKHLFFSLISLGKRVEGNTFVHLQMRTAKERPFDEWSERATGGERKTSVCVGMSEEELTVGKYTVHILFGDEV